MDTLLQAGQLATTSSSVGGILWQGSGKDKPLPHRAAGNEKSLPHNGGLIINFDTVRGVVALLVVPRN